MSNGEKQKERLSAVVTGPICIDVFGAGFPRFSEYANDDNLFGSSFNIAAGGKARNIAQMIAELIGPGRVALSGRVCQDPFQLWRMIIQPLEAAGVVTDSICLVPYIAGESEPAVIMILVDESGHSKYFSLNSLNEQFSAQDVDQAICLLEEAGGNSGFVVICLGQPLATVLYTVRKAREFGLKILLDPGGFNFKYDYSEICRHRFFMIKPNIQEAEFFADMRIGNLDDARRAARKLMETMAENVLISLGAEGALLVTSQAEVLIKVPELYVKPAIDATGCGDQMVAAGCAALINGSTMEEAARLGVIAGALQAQKQGVVPISREEIKDLQ